MYHFRSSACFRPIRKVAICMICSFIIPLFASMPLPVKMAPDTLNLLSVLSHMLLSITTLIHP